MVCKFDSVYLRNFLCRWPDILEIDTLTILPCSNWLLIKVNVNLESSSCYLFYENSKNKNDYFQIETFAWHLNALTENMMQNVPKIKV